MPEAEKTEQKLTMRLFIDGEEKHSVVGIVYDATLDSEIDWKGDSQGKSTIGMSYKGVKTVAEAFGKIMEAAKSAYPNAKSKRVELKYEKIG